MQYGTSLKPGRCPGQAAATSLMHHPQMLHARTRVTLATGATLAALLGLAALAHPVLADGLPTPLPDAISGPLTQTLLDAVEAQGLSCELTSGPPADEYACSRTVGNRVFYVANFYADPSLVMELYVSGPLPWPEDHDNFLVTLTSLFCPTDQLEPIATLVVAARQAGPGGVTLDNPACFIASDYVAQPIPDQLVAAFAKVDPAALPTLPPSLLPTAPPLATPTFLPTAAPTPAPTASPAPTAAPSPTPAPTAVPAGGGGSNIEPGGFVRSVPPPSQVSSEPLVIAESLALAGLIVLLMPFPAQLFNSTLEAHYATVRRWFRLDKLQAATGRVSGFWDSLVGILVFVLLSAAIYALLDPDVGLDARSAATIVGLAIGIVVTTVMASAPSLVDALRNHGKWRLRALPATLIVGLACVLVSRLTGFLPGYLYGVILGFVFARELTRAEQGRANALAAALLLAVGILAWLALAVIGPNPSGIVATIAATALSTLLVAGLEAVVFGLLPFRFLPGEPLHATNRLLWAALLLVGAFCFFHILINPSSGYLSSSSRTPLLTIVVLFAAFGLLSVAFWAYFRNKPLPEESGRP